MQIVNVDKKMHLIINDDRKKLTWNSYQASKTVISWKLLSRKDTRYSDKSLSTAVTIKLPFLFLSPSEREMASK